MDSMTTLATTRIGQVHVSVTDVDRSVAFYRDVLGLPFLFRVPGQPMAFFDCGGTRLYLATPEEGFRSQPLLYFTVDAIDEARAALLAKGVDFGDEPHLVHRDDSSELWMTFFRDPDGCTLALMEERPV
jgi:catechol 2,3-dioxygenase-like lactoylglutathione lyase family enzyme